MDMIYILVPLAVFLSLVALGMLIWSIRHGQFDDLVGPAHRILFEDDQDLVPGPKAGTQEQSPPTGDEPLGRG